MFFITSSEGFLPTIRVQNAKKNRVVVAVLQQQMPQDLVSTAANSRGGVHYLPDSVQRSYLLSDMEKRASRNIS